MLLYFYRKSCQACDFSLCREYVFSGKAVSLNRNTPRAETVRKELTVIASALLFTHVFGKIAQRRPQQANENIDSRPMLLLS